MSNNSNNISNLKKMYESNNTVLTQLLLTSNNNV